MIETDTSHQSLSIVVRSGAAHVSLDADSRRRWQRQIQPLLRFAAAVGGRKRPCGWCVGATDHLKPALLQPGLLRSLDSREWSDGTLRYVLLGQRLADSSGTHARSAQRTGNQPAP